MPFDPTSAQPVQQNSGFDPSTASPVGQGFDPTSAKALPDIPKNAQQGVTAEGIKQGGIITDPDSGGIMGTLGRAAKAVEGAYMGADLNWFGGEAARLIHKATGYAGTPWSTSAIEAQHPGQDPALTRSIQEDYERANVIGKRQQYDNQVKQNSQGFNPATIVAGIAGSADPTWAINPAAGLTKGLMVRGGEKVVAHILANTAAHAAMGSASDAAYQIADQIDGVKKDFDIQQNLTNAGMQGILGGGVQAVHEVAPFIADLFKKRGVDTTPSDTPAGVTTPLTGQGLSPEETAQYHEVLKTGDVHDIRNFFEGRNTPPPSFADAHEWVSRRDAVADGSAPADYADEMFHPELPQVDQRPAVEQHIQSETGNWKNAPDYEVINHTDDIQDPRVRQAAVDEGVSHESDHLGFLGDDGKVRIFANKIDSPETLNALLYHESLGHYGLAQKFGDKLDSTLQTLMDRNVGQFGKDVDAWQAKNPDAYGGNRVRAAEEVLANMSNDGVIKPSIADAITAHVRDFGRKMGLDLKYSDGEIRTILGMAHDAVINGKGRDATANGFKFMRGKKDDGSDFRPLVFHGGDNFNDIDPAKFGSGEPGGIRPLGRDKLYGSVAMSPEEIPTAIEHARIYSKYGANEPTIHAFHADVEDRHVQNIGYDKGKWARGGEDGRYELEALPWKPSADHLNAVEGAFHPSELERVNKWSADTPTDKILSDLKNTNKFMRRSDLRPKDVAEEAFERLGKDYEPTKRSWDESIAMAKDTPLDLDKLTAARSAGNLDKKLFQYDQAAREANETLTALADHAAKTGGLDNDQHELLVKTAAQFAYALGRIENDANQIGRALNAMKAIDFSRKNLMGLRDALEKEGSNLAALSDGDNALRFLKQYSAMTKNGNPNGAAFLTKGLTEPYWEQYLLSYRHSMMLSGLATHIKNFADNTTMGLRELEEHILAMPLGAVRAAINSIGGDVKPGAHPTEVMAHMWGLMRAAVDASTWVDAGKAFLDGPDIQHISKNTSMADARIPVLSKVGDALHAVDTFQRAFLMNANLYTIGARKAYGEMKLASKSGDVKWDDVMSQGSNYARLPTKDMLAEAKGNTDQALLVNKAPLTGGIEKLKQYRPGMGVAERMSAFFANLFFPFIRVGANSIQNQIIRRSPFALVLDKVTQDDLRAGGARADIAVTRMILGTVALVNMWNMGSKALDKMTGEDPRSAAKAAALHSAGVVPQAVHEDGKYKVANSLAMSVNPLDLHNSTATMVAGLRQAYETGKADKGQTVTGLKLAMLSLLHNLSGQSFINNLTPVVDALDQHDDGSKLTSFLGSEARTMMPNVTNQMAHQIDPNQHDTHADGSMLGQIGATIQSNIPGAASKLPIKYSVYGEPLKTGSTVAGVHIPLLSDGNHQNEPTDPTIKELARLEKLTPVAVVTPVQRTIKVEGVPLKLNSDQFEEYQKYAGQTIVQAVRDQQSSGEWAKMSDLEKVRELKSLQTEAKKEVREALLQKEGWLKSDQLDSLRAQLNGQQ